MELEKIGLRVIKVNNEFYMIQKLFYVGFMKKKEVWKTYGLKIRLNKMEDFFTIKVHWYKNINNEKCNKYSSEDEALNEMFRMKMEYYENEIKNIEVIKEI